MTDDDIPRLGRTISTEEIFRGTRPRPIDGASAPVICPAMELARTLAIQRAKESAHRLRAEAAMTKEREPAPRRWIVLSREVGTEMPVREPTERDYVVDQLPPWAFAELVTLRTERIARWYPVTESSLVARTRTGQVLIVTRDTAGLVYVDAGRRPEVEE